MDRFKNVGRIVMSEQQAANIDRPQPESIDNSKVIATNPRPKHEEEVQYEFNKSDHHHHHHRKEDVHHHHNHPEDSQSSSSEERRRRNVSDHERGLKRSHHGK